MFNGVLLVAIIANWILKVISLPKLYYQNLLTIKGKTKQINMTLYDRYSLNLFY